MWRYLAPVVALSACTALSGLDDLEFTGGQAGGAGGVGGSGGAAAECVNNTDCEVNNPCLEARCEGGQCQVEPLAMSTPCGIGRLCDDMGNCLLDIGANCGLSSECLNGHCADGLCCDSACDGECVSCALAGLEGSCTPHPDGTDPDDDCDNICDGAGVCLDGDFVFAGGFGSAAAQTANDVAIDSAGNVIIVGDFANTIDFGAGVLQSAGSADMFIAKFSPAGALLWAFRYGGDSGQMGVEVEVDSFDNIVVGGYFAGTLNLGVSAMTAQGGVDAFLAKLTADGLAVWSNQFGGSANEQLLTIDIAANDDIAIGGFSEGDIDLGGGVLAGAGGRDGWVAVYSGEGAYKWSNRFGDPSAQKVDGVAFGANNDLVVVGSFEGSIDLGVGPLTSAGGADIFVAMFDQAGAPAWSQRYGDGGGQDARDVARDSAGAVVLTGVNTGTVNFGGSDITSAGNDDLYVAKLSATGDHLFSLGAGDGNFQRGDAIALDTRDHILLIGTMRGVADFGGGTVNAAGVDGFVVKLEDDGSYLWSYALGGGAVDSAKGVTVGPNDEVAVVGLYSSPNFDPGGGVLPAADAADAFVVKLGP